ncbi:MAG: hypothetical protein R3E83_06535 [Burkholderiaceae bacterium]
MAPPSALTPRHKTLLASAVSGAFFDAYHDLLDSLDALALSDEFAFGTIDLGLTGAQRTMLADRGAIIVTPAWPISPPSRQNRIEHLAHVARPFANRIFPGYSRYVWMDADMWLQDAGAWTALIEGADAIGMAAPSEDSPAYGPVPWPEHFWLMRRLLRAYGPMTMLRLMNRPMINSGMFALRGDAPQWQQWQQETHRVVRRTDRAIAADQIALFRLVHDARMKVSLLAPRHNWICSRALPVWDDRRAVFVTPQEPAAVITVMHNTTPSRHRRFSVATTSGQQLEMFLHRPAGHVEQALLGQDRAVSRPGTQAVPCAAKAPAESATARPASAA